MMRDVAVAAGAACLGFSTGRRSILVVPGLAILAGGFLVAAEFLTEAGPDDIGDDVALLTSAVAAALAAALGVGLRKWWSRRRPTE